MYYFQSKYLSVGQDVVLPHCFAVSDSQHCVGTQCAANMPGFSLFKFPTLFGRKHSSYKLGRPVSAAQHNIGHCTPLRRSCPPSRSSWTGRRSRSSSRPNRPSQHLATTGKLGGPGAAGGNHWFIFIKNLLNQKYLNDMHWFIVLVRVKMPDCDVFLDAQQL